MEVAQLRDRLGAALAGAPSALDAADRLCEACVQLLDVDGASISLVEAGAPQGTFGSSGSLSRTLDELQFTYGEGPCQDAVAQRRPVLAEDLDGPDGDRWPALSEVMLAHGIRAVFALPVTVVSAPIGALDLYRRRRGPLDGDFLAAGLWAAGLAALPVLDLSTAEVDWEAAGYAEAGWEQLASLERIEVYQATGMIVAGLDVPAAEALVRLRAHAISHGLTASQVAYMVLDRRLVPEDGELRPQQPGAL